MDLLNNTLSNIDLSNLILLVTTAGASVAAALVNVQKKLKDHVVSLISAAEGEYANQEKAGTSKHAWVVTRLYRMVPLPLRPLFSQRLISNIVVSAFSSIESYASLQAAKDSEPSPPFLFEAPVPELPEENMAEPAQKGHASGHASDAEIERRKPEHVTKTNSANQQMPHHRLIQNPRIQSSIRIHAFWHRHGIIRGTEYHIRKWERRSNTHRLR